MRTPPKLALLLPLKGVDGFFQRKIKRFHKLSHVTKDNGESKKEFSKGESNI